MARIGLAVAGISALAVLTACGGNGFADESADKIVKTAKADMGDLTAVKVQGQITSSGQQISLDLQNSSNGDCTGTIGIGDGSTQMLGVDGKTWMKPDASFWQSMVGDSADQVMAAVGDKWVIIPDSAQSLSSFCNTTDLLDNMLKDNNDGSTYAKNGTAEVDGEKVVKVDDKSPDQGTSTGYVLVDDPHYLVKLEKTDGEDTGTVTFSGFNEKFDVTAPADDEVFDLNSLSG